jgi:hypothetical protein
VIAAYGGVGEGRLAMKPVKSVVSAAKTDPRVAGDEDGEALVPKVRRPAEPELKPVNFPAVRVSAPERQEKAFNIRVPWPADGPGMSRYVERQDQIPHREPEPPATAAYERYPGLVREAGDPERDRRRGR